TSGTWWHGPAAETTITAQYGFTQCVSINVSDGPTVTGVQLSPASVVAGTQSTLTITLAATAPSGGAPIVLSCDRQTIQLPPSITIASGQTSASLLIDTSSIQSPTLATFTAQYSGVATATL